MTIVEKRQKISLWCGMLTSLACAIGQAVQAYYLYIKIEMLQQLDSNINISRIILDIYIKNSIYFLFFCLLFGYCLWGGRRKWTTGNIEGRNEPTNN